VIEDDDPKGLAPVRGILVGLVLSMTIWAVVMWAAWKVVG
jgi:hypothetical protein